MSVGFPSSKSDFDSRAGQLCTAVRQNLYNCSQFSALLQGAPWATDANMVALGSPAGEVRLRRGGFPARGGRGSSLSRIANGLALGGRKNNFFSNTNHLWGVVGPGCPAFSPPPRGGGTSCPP